jgi:hypothetical protein
MLYNLIFIDYLYNSQMDPSRIERIKHLKNDMGYNVNSILGILGITNSASPGPDNFKEIPPEFKEVYTVDEILPQMMGLKYRKTILDKLYGEAEVERAYADYWDGLTPRERARSNIFADIGAQTLVHGAPEKTPGGSRKRRQRRNGKKSKTKLHTSRKSRVRRRR